MIKLFYIYKKYNGHKIKTIFRSFKFLINLIYKKHDGIIVLNFHKLITLIKLPKSTILYFRFGVRFKEVIL